MNCLHVREQILESFDASPPATQTHEITAHLAECPACAAFATRQRALDNRLAVMFSAVEPTAALRHTLRAQTRDQTMTAWHDLLPDVIHFASCGIAIVFSVIVLPIAPLTVAGVGVTAALATYLLLTMARQPFESEGEV